VGRRGIPYLDWGLFQGGQYPGWIRDTALDGCYSPKKNVYSQSQQGTLSEQTGWPASTTANNVNLIRYADVLLWAAEVEAEIGLLDKAREYVNQIRRRAKNPAGMVHTYIDPNNPSLGFTNTPAANYKIEEYSQPWTDRDSALIAIRHERVLELGMEGHRFFDLVRWGIAETKINDYLQKEKTLRKYLNDAFFEKGCDEYFPIPQVQLDLSAGADGIRKMTQNPCY
jgi:hypothetical protein